MSADEDERTTLKLTKLCPHRGFSASRPGKHLNEDPGASNRMFEGNLLCEGGAKHSSLSSSALVALRAEIRRFTLTSIFGSGRGSIFEFRGQFLEVPELSFKMKILSFCVVLGGPGDVWRCLQIRMNEQH